MEKLDQYFKLQQEIYKHFGYVEDWVVIPLDDAREYFWMLSESEGLVRFAETEEMLFNEEKNDYYKNEIYTQRFLPRWVYRATDYTMIYVDTHTDGNKFLQIFDNSKERHEKRE